MIVRGDDIPNGAGVECGQRDLQFGCDLGEFGVDEEGPVGADGCKDIATGAVEEIGVWGEFADIDLEICPVGGEAVGDAPRRGGGLGGSSVRHDGDRNEHGDCCHAGHAEWGFEGYR